MNEEFERRWERKVEFLLNQQAKFDADMEEMKKHHAAIDKKLDRITETVSSLTSLVFEGFKITDARIQALAESHKELQKALAESQKLTDEKLRDLTVLVDRHIREGHHGSAN
jgi:archaellum component FlaC